MKTMILSACIALLALHASSRRSSATDCPQSCLSVSWPEVCTSAARMDTTGNGGPFGICGNEAGFEIPAGSLFCTTVGGYGNCQGGIDVADDFVLLGPATGSAVNVRVELAISVSSWAGDMTTGTIQRDDTALAAWSHTFADGDPISEADTTLNEPIRVVAGTPFRLHFTLYNSAGGDAIHTEGRASFSFGGLGSGQRVESCKGFVQASTPALPVTWGRVKSLYR